jgi:OOP family OmpA-OmpF porin
MSLSRDRANSVKTYLVNAGIAAGRIATSAYGESRPLASNSTEAGRTQNRRVEFKQQ